MHGLKGGVQDNSNHIQIAQLFLSTSLGVKHVCVKTDWNLGGGEYLNATALFLGWRMCKVSAARYAYIILLVI